MMTAELTPADHAAVSSASKILCSRYRGHVEFEDVQQELYLWLYQNHDKAERWREEREPGYAERTLVKALRSVGEKFCRAEKAHHLGYDPEDEFFYSIPMVADLLLVHFDPDWTAPSSPNLEKVSRPGSANDGMNLAAMVADVGRALNGLTEADSALLTRVYGGGEGASVDVVAALACEWDITYAAATSRVRRVVGRLRAALGGPNPYGRKSE